MRDIVTMSAPMPLVRTPDEMKARLVTYFKECALAIRAPTTR